MCVCGGGGGSVTSFKVNFKFPKFQGGGGPTYVIQGGGGGGVKLFSNGIGVQLLSDRTHDLYCTPIPALDPCNCHEFYSTTANFYLAVYFRLSSRMHV